MNRNKLSGEFGVLHAAFTFVLLPSNISEHIRHRSEVCRKETEPESWQELGIDKVLGNSQS